MVFFVLVPFLRRIFIIILHLMKFLNFSCVAFFLFLSACSISQYVVQPVKDADQQVTVTVNYDPKLVINTKPVTILIINQFNFGVLNIGTEKKLAAIKAGAFTAVRYAETQLKQLNNVKVINIIDSAAFIINVDSVKALALKYNANYVLALKYFSAAIPMANTDGYTAYYNTDVKVNFVLYEDNGVYSKKLDGEANDPHSSGEYQGLLGSLIIHPTIRGNKDAIAISAQNAAQIALQEYLPASISHVRPLFNEAVFKPAVHEILAGNFNKADSLLTPLLKDTSKTIASKAAYNLSVVYEAEGDIEGAIAKAQQAIDIDKNDHALAIIEDLKQE